MLGSTNIPVSVGAAMKRWDDLVLTPRGLRFCGQIYPCTIGRAGLTANKAEGDMATPIGVHHIVAMLYRPDRLPAPNTWASPILPGDLWSDDPNDPEYNQMVRASYAPSHEELRRSDPMYDLIFVTDWNWPNATTGKGSCIFMHQWRRMGYPTAGCVALRRDHLWQLATMIQPGTRLYI